MQRIGLFISLTLLELYKSLCAVGAQTIKLLHKIATKTIDTILPPRCPVSGDIVSKQGLSAAHIWQDYDFISSPHCQSCGEPFAFHTADNLTCASCLDKPPQFTKARSAMIYNDAAKALVLSFKHADKLHIVRNFTPWLIRAGHDIWGDADILIPVPLHYWRMVKRLYNQAAVISDHLSKHLDLPSVKGVLVRTRSTASQGHKSRQDRFDNIKGAFKVKPNKRKLIEGKRIVLVDDVITTGATVKECTKILLENGAASVHIITVARVPAPT